MAGFQNFRGSEWFAFCPATYVAGLSYTSLMKLSEQPPRRWKKSFNYCFLLDSCLRPWSDTCKADRAQELGHRFHAAEHKYRNWAQSVWESKAGRLKFRLSCGGT